MNKKGFTLVELSIVLVIIGLLIGGILAAQSMIKTTKIQAVIRQVGQFDAAIENFQTKYQQLLGDTNLMGGQPGDNNGVVNAGDDANSSYYVGEVLKFWADLSKSGLVSPNGNPYQDISATNAYDGNPEDYFPRSMDSDSYRSDSQGKTYFFIIGSSASSKNYYFVGALNPSLFVNFQGESPLYSFAPSTVLAIDQKIDDGLANSGNVTGADIGNMRGLSVMDGGTSSGNACTINSGLTTYNLSGASNTGCQLKIQFGTSTSDLK